MVARYSYLDGAGGIAVGPAKAVAAGVYMDFLVPGHARWWLWFI